jgi:hypothetical protein
MRVAVVSGDGLAVSGLLTTLRNAVFLGRTVGHIAHPIPIEFGFAWRPDKTGDTLRDRSGAPTPDWLVHAPAVEFPDTAAAVADLNLCRDSARDWPLLDPSRRAAFREADARLYAVLALHFDRWLGEAAPDWVICLNMTLTDSVSATRALMDALSRHFRDRPGGAVFWDHDLFGTYAVREGNTAVYPTRPNEATPLPTRRSCRRWVVVSPALHREALGYGVDVVPEYIPNPLPRIASGDDAAVVETLHRFQCDWQLEGERPFVLMPVRIFHVKGVELAVRWFGRLQKEVAALGRRPPYLLVFGSLDEEPPYARYVQELAQRLALVGDVIWLDGVPLSPIVRDSRYVPSEVELLMMARATRGGLAFTPAVKDVESVGLGPALAAVARIPCAVTEYNAFEELYGSGYHCTPIDAGDERPSAVAFAAVLDAFADDDPVLAAQLEENAATVREVFSDGPWLALWRKLHESGSQR